MISCSAGFSAELTKVYHAVKHYHSYNSTDCGLKLDAIVFPDSSITKQLACSRTKSEALVECVLAPKSVEGIVSDLTSVSDVSCTPRLFSVSTDASNMKNRKHFPVCLQYFCVDGVRKKLLDFVEQNSETSNEIADMIMATLTGNDLTVDYYWIQY
jgi:hypothetical protein